MTIDLMDARTSPAEVGPLLTALGAFAPLPADEQDALAALCGRRVLAQDDYLVRAGERTDVMGFTERGLLRYFYVDADGAEYTRYFCAGGGVVASYSALVRGGPSAYSIQVQEDSVLLTFPWAGWQRLLARHHILGRHPSGPRRSRPPRGGGARALAHPR